MIETKAGRVLHVGCGGGTLPPWLENFDEVRLDVDPRCSPDIVASVTELGDIGEYEAVFCSHILEHLYPYELPKALSEIKRVLVPGGMVAVFVPDMEDVRPSEEVLYVSPAGPITGLDMFYGLRSALETMPHMAHHNAFIQGTLTQALESAGFSKVIVNRLSSWQLFGAAVK